MLHVGNFAILSQNMYDPFIDQGEVEAMKTPIGCRAPRRGKDQFRTKMKVST